MRCSFCTCLLILLSIIACIALSVSHQYFAICLPLGVCSLHIQYVLTAVRTKITRHSCSTYSKQVSGKEQEAWWVNTAESSSWSMVFKLYFVETLRANAARMLSCMFLKTKEESQTIFSTLELARSFYWQTRKCERLLTGVGNGRSTQLKFRIRRGMFY